MGINAGMMSSDSKEWATPQNFFDRLDAIYHFTLDAAASRENTKCDQFYTKEDNALGLSWRGRVWCNPPYGREIPRWVEKGYYEAQQPHNTVVVMLLAARTDTRWWHDWVMKAKVIYLVRGRLKFVGGASSAPFPSAVVQFGFGTDASPPPVFRVIRAKED